MWRLRRTAASSNSFRRWCAEQCGIRPGVLDNLQASPYRQSRRLFSGVLARKPRLDKSLVVSGTYRSGSSYRSVATPIKRVSNARDETSEDDDFSDADELEDEADDLDDLDDDQTGEDDDDDDDEDSEEDKPVEAVKKKSSKSGKSGEEQQKREKGKPEASTKTREAPKREERSAAGRDAPFDKRLNGLDQKSLSLLKNLMAVKRADASDVVTVVQEWKANNDLTASVFYFVAEKLRKQQRWAQALELLEWAAKEKQFVESPMSAVNLIDCTARVRGLPEAEKIFNDLEQDKKTRAVCNILLLHYCTSGLKEKAEKLYEEMREMGLVKDTSFAINQMIRLYQKKGNSKKIQEILAQAKEAGITADIHTYNELMSVKCRAKDIEGMEKMWNEVKISDTLKPDARTYLVLAQGYLHAGLHDKCELSLMRLEYGPFPKLRIMYDTMIRMYGEVGNMVEVDRLWHKVRNMNGSLINSQISLLSALGCMGKYERAQRLHQQMLKYKFSSNTIKKCYNCLLHAYAQHGMVDKIKEIMLEMEEADVKPDSISNQHLATAQAKKNEKKDTVAIEAGTEGEGVTGTEGGVTGTDEGSTKQKEKEKDKKKGKKGEKAACVKELESVAESGDVKGSERCFEECKKSGLVKNVHVWNKLLSAYAKAAVPAYGFTQRMSAEKVQPNDETRSLLKQLNLD